MISRRGRKRFLPAIVRSTSKMPHNRASDTADSYRVFGHSSHRRKNPVRAGLYAHVSTHDQQTLPLQRRAMRDYVGRRGWAIAVDIKEIGSGASVRELRQKLLEAARRRDIDVVVVWRLDRWGRSMADLVTTLQELRDLGVGFISLTETHHANRPGDGWFTCLFSEFERIFYASASVLDWLMPGITANV